MSSLTEIELFNNGSAYPQNYRQTYLATKHIAHFKLKYDKDLLTKFEDALKANDFFLPNEDTKYLIITALLNGNIILQGPPGTGKTTLAKIISEVFNCSSEVITATSDWTTYDTIGGLHPDVDVDGNEIIVGKNGKVVESIIKCAETILSNEINHDSSADNQAHWLIIDELNRSEIDRVFGELFTVFGSISSNPRELKLWFNKDENLASVYVPNRYRIIGTINNVDKNYVNSLSQGLTRRFSLITINPPKEPQFLDELEFVKKNVKKNMLIKSDLATSDSDIDKVLTNPSFSTIETRMIDLLKHIRYEGDKHLGLNIGTAQLIDVYELVITKLLIINKMDDDDVYLAFDNAVVEKILSLADGFYFENIKEFLAYMNDNHSKMANCIEKLESLLL